MYLNVSINYLSNINCKFIMRTLNIMIVEVKFPKSTVGLWPRTEPNHDQKGKRRPRDFWPNPVEPCLF